jgi:hypothetical protein
LAGWKRYKNHPDERIRRRYMWEARELATTFSALVGAVRLYYRDNPRMEAKARLILQDLASEFGLESRFYAAIGGRYVLHTIRQEEKRLARGWTYEPPTFYETNFEPPVGSGARRNQSVVAQAVPTPVPRISTG